MHVHLQGLDFLLGFLGEHPNVLLRVVPQVEFLCTWEVRLTGQDSLYSAPHLTRLTERPIGVGNLMTEFYSLPAFSAQQGIESRIRGVRGAVNRPWVYSSISRWTVQGLCTIRTSRGLCAIKGVLPIGRNAYHGNYASLGLTLSIGRGLTLVNEELSLVDRGLSHCTHCTGFVVVLLELFGLGGQHMHANASMGSDAEDIQLHICRQQADSMWSN